MILVKRARGLPGILLHSGASLGTFAPMIQNAPLARAERTAKKNLARIGARARRDIALIKRRKHDIAGAFYDIGQALIRLKDPAVIRALGHQSFAALCESELELSVPQADRLIDIVRGMTRHEAAKLGPARAAALVDLVSATPGRDTARGAIRRGVKLPGGKKLNPRTASARAMESAAKSVRAATRPAKGRGRHVAREELALGAALEKKLRVEGVAAAKVAVLAGPPGKPARARIDGVELAQLGRLATAIRAVARSSA